MADQYIDQYETLGYGNFASAQILGMLVGLDAAYDPTLAIVAGRVDKATKAMEAALNKAGALTVVTYKPAEGEADVVEAARKVMRRLVKYAESREKGESSRSAKPTSPSTTHGRRTSQPRVTRSTSSTRTCARPG